MDSNNEKASSNNEGQLTLEKLRKSGHPALERIADRAAKNMQSSAYVSHNSHHSAHN